MPDRENGDDDLKVTNEDNTIDEDKLKPSSSQIIEASKEKQKDCSEPKKESGEPL